MTDHEQQPDFLPEIRYGKIKVLKLYQISDDELTRLGQGSGQSLHLNFAIFVFSVAVSFFISLLTTPKTSDRLLIVFVIIIAGCFLAGIVLMIQWWCARKPISRLVQEIRDRVPPEGEAQQLSPASSERRAHESSGAGGP